MPCEKCWADAYYIEQFGGTDETQADAYARLLRERAENPCSPEQQAGPGAERCPDCGTMTVHPITKSCKAVFHHGG